MKRILALYKNFIDNKRKQPQKELSIDPKRQITISEETEKKILRHLTNFEKKNHFLSHNVSLSSMSKDFSTNASYLSASIKKLRNNSFNGYINDMRINYIILKLNTNPEYFN